jgi:RNA polymerase sigma-70 factor, ECF subfamily
MIAQLDEATPAQAIGPSLAGAADPDDLALIVAIAQGDNQAFGLLYDRYSTVVYRLALRMLKNPEMAEDLVQEVFWRVWRRGASFERERGRVAQWLFGIAHNLCIDELRRLRARPTPVYEDVEHPLIQRLVDEQSDIPSAVWATERRRAIVEAMHELPAPQRQALELAYFGGLSHQEIATKLQKPLGTIKTRVRLGLQKLGGLLEAQGLQPADL